MSMGSTSSRETGLMLKTNLAHQDTWLLSSPCNFPTQRKQFCCKKLDCTRKIQLIICYFSSRETLEHTNRLGSEWNLKLSLVSIIEKMAWRVVRSHGKGELSCTKSKYHTSTHRECHIKFIMGLRFLNKSLQKPMNLSHSTATT
jgi:hypothetical protein